MFRKPRTAKIGGRLEVAQQMAAHESAKTTGLYDRRNDEVSLAEAEETAHWTNMRSIFPRTQGSAAQVVDFRAVRR
ncbi:MAG TPA: hypothetical protein VNW54_15560 [Granulicella sp.]|jgi:hypothetical protein|nr:hypothetical protein [Granulicella sp.]